MFADGLKPSVFVIRTESSLTFERSNWIFIPFCGSMYVGVPFLTSAIIT